MGIIKHIKNLIKGMGITSKHLGRHAITIQYPEEKMEMFERSRGVVVLLSDKKTGDLNCTACALCEKACPTRAIKIEWHRDEAKKKHLDGFVIDFGLCCFCGLCEEACNFCAIKMTGKYEFSTLDKSDIIWDVKKLQEIGCDVPYEDTRKKKKPKPKPAAKPATDKAEAKPAPVKAEAKPEESKKEAPPQAEPKEPKKEAQPPAEPKEPKNEAQPPAPEKNDSEGEKS